MSLSVRAVVLGISALLALGVAHAQDEAVQKLVGRWEGKVDVREAPEHTLIVRSLRLVGNQWLADIDYGPNGTEPSHLEARIERQGEKTTLSFAISTTRKVDLQLLSERELRGLLKISDASGSWVPRRMILHKTSDKP